MEAKDLNKDSSRQEIFNFVVAHLRKQGKKAIQEAEDGGEQCAYLARDGSKCAVGCLILPEEYNPKMEGHVIRDLFGGGTRLRSLISNHFTLLEDLQRLHDQNHPGTWESMFRLTAMRWCLELPAQG